MDTAGSTPVRSPFRRFASSVASTLAAQPDATQDPTPAKRVFHRAVPYVLSAGSVAAALYGSSILERLGIRNLEFAALSVRDRVNRLVSQRRPRGSRGVLSALTFNYYFTEPRYTFWVRPPTPPYYVAFRSLP